MESSEVKYCPFCGGEDIYMEVKELTRISLVSNKPVKGRFEVWHCRKEGCEMNRDGYFCHWDIEPLKNES